MGVEVVCGSRKRRARLGYMIRSEVQEVFLVFSLQPVCCLALLCHFIVGFVYRTQPTIYIANISRYTSLIETIASA